MPVNQIVEQLRSEETRITTDIERLNQELKTCNAELKRIQTALAALGSKTTGNATRKATKPAATKMDVIEAVEAALRVNPVLDPDALKAVVQEQLATSGKSMQGFALRFAEATKDQRFVQSPEGYQVRRDESQQVR